MQVRMTTRMRMKDRVRKMRGEMTKKTCMNTGIWKRLTRLLILILKGAVRMGTRMLYVASMIFVYDLIAIFYFYQHDHKANGHSLLDRFNSVGTGSTMKRLSKRQQEKAPEDRPVHVDDGRAEDHGSPEGDVADG